MHKLMLYVKNRNVMYNVTDDYHNSTFTGNTGGCPRKPWHDLHSKFVGPVAYIVLPIFEERWLRAANSTGPQDLKSSIADAFLKLERHTRGVVAMSWFFCSLGRFC